MFGIGSTELIVILVIALLVLGPKNLPKIAQTLGKAMGQFQKVSKDFQRTLNTEVALEEEADKRQEQERLVAEQEAVQTAKKEAEKEQNETKSAPKSPSAKTSTETAPKNTPKTVIDTPISTTADTTTDTAASTKTGSKKSA